MTLNAGGGTLDTNGNGLTLTGGIGGVGGLTKIGAGTLTLSGANSYAGGTTIDAGTLAVSSDGNLGAASGGLTFDGGTLRALGSIASARSIVLNAGGGTLDANGNQVLLTGTIGGVGGLVATGAGTLTLGQINAYGGATTIDAGARLALSGSGSIASSSGVAANGTFDISQTAGSQIATLSGSGAVALGSQMLTIANGSTTFSGVLADGGLGGGTAGCLIVSGGVQTLAGVNTYTGSTVVNAGAVLALSGTGAIASSSEVAVAGTLDLSQTAAGAQIATLSGGGLIDLGGKTLTIASGATTFSGVIADGGLGGGSGGGLTIAGGVETLTGANTYTGATNVLAGKLVVNGSLASSNVTIGNGATLAGSGTLSNGVTILSGGTLAPGNSPGTITLGALTLNAGSILAYDLGAANTIGGPSNDLTHVTGALTINGGVLNVTDSGGFGLGAYRIFDYGGALGGSGSLTVGALPNGETGVIQTAIPGQVNLVVTGPGTLVQYFDGATTNGDGTIHGGTGVWNNGATNWTAPNGAINASWLGGFGIFAAAAGVATVDAPAAFQGLQFSSDGYVVTGSGAGALDPTGQATILVDSGATATIAATIAGSGGIVKGNGGRLILTGSNTYAGGTNLTSGTLGVGSATALGTGALTMAGATILQAESSLTLANAISLSGAEAGVDTQGNALTLTGAISGSGGLDKMGSGALILSGAGSYAGPTFIDGGALQAGGTGVLAQASAFTIASGARLDLAGFDQTIGSLAGAGGVTLGAGVLTTGGDGSSTVFSGTISGSGGLIKTGSGALGLSGTSSYTGATSIQAGSLIVDGAIASSAVTVGAGALLGGGGVVGSLTAQNGSMVAPGALTPYRTLHVAGDVSLRSGSTYVVGLDATGRTDAIFATGAATLSGAKVEVTAKAGGVYSPTIRYTIVTAQKGVADRFASLTTVSDLAFLTPVLSYDADDVYLSFSQLSGGFVSAAWTPNERATAAAVQGLGSGVLYNGVLGQNAAGARQAFDALSGEIHASEVSAAFDDARLPREAVLDRLANPDGLWGNGGAGGFASTNAIAQPGPPSTLYEAWGQAFGSFGHIGGDGNAATLARSLGGFIVGLDASFDQRYRVGVAGGYTQSKLGLDARGSSGRVNSTYVGLYGGAAFNALQLSAGAFYAYNRYGANRTIAFPGFDDAASSGYGGDAVQAFAEAGWRLRLSGFAEGASVEPFVGAMAMHIDTARFAEAGGPAALIGGSGDYNYGATTLGLRTETTLFSSAPLLARSMIGWRHVFGDVTPDANMNFASAPSLPAFVIAGAPIATDALIIEAGVDWRFTQNASLGLYYSGAIGNKDIENAIKGKIDMAF